MHDNKQTLIINELLVTYCFSIEFIEFNFLVVCFFQYKKDNRIVIKIERKCRKFMHDQAYKTLKATYITHCTKMKNTLLENSFFVQ